MSKQKSQEWDDDPVVKKLVRGKFTRAVLKDGAVKAGKNLDNWMYKLKDEHYTNEEFAARIHYRFPSREALKPPPLAGVKGTLSPPELSFVYLDVGAWVGSKDRPWGQSDNAKYIKRDFGIVCGPLVVLGTFEHCWSKGHCQAWKDAKKDKEPFKSVAALIDALSKPAGPEDHAATAAGKGLSNAVVRDMTLAPATNPRWPADEKKWIIHVIVGDMHIPVLSEEIQTFGGAALIGEEGKHKVGYVPERVPRLGRLNLRTLEELVTLLVKKGDDGAKMLEKIVKLATPALDIPPEEWARMKDAFMDDTVAQVEVGAALVPALAGTLQIIAGILEVSPVVLEEVWRTGDWSGLKHGTMSRADADRWYKYYREGVDGGRPADIFENAGEHFRHFVERLGAYLDLDSGLPVRLLQLGDMMDFWVGFTCHYQPSGGPDMPVATIDEHGRDMIEKWTENMFGHTAQGKHVAEAIEVAKAAGLAPHFLYGNHDNYLGSGITARYPYKDGKPRYLDQRKARYSEEGLFMEHGHQWEPSNSDGKPNGGVLGFVGNYTLGSPSPMGMFVTQAAFIRPGQIRAFEGQAAGAVGRISGTFGQRLDQVVGASYRFWKSAQSFYCYVMGHTHSACLTQIVMSTEGTIETFRTDSDKNPRCEVYLTDGGRRIDRENVFVDRVVTVKWTDMLGDENNEWVTLADPESPRPGSFRTAVKDLAVKSGNKEDSAVFASVPPGRWLARYFLTRDARQCFRQSENHVSVEGLSLEGDHDHTETVEVEYDEGKLTRPLVLRWAFQDPRGFENEAGVDPGQAFFALYRRGEANESTSLLSYSPPHPIKRFTHAAPSHPTWGRFDLAFNFPIWDLTDLASSPHDHGGHWEIRAFRDATMKKPLGKVLSLHVKKKPAEHGKKKKGHP